MIEIERKFLVTSEEFKNEAFKTSKIIQGFLNTDPERAVRVRLIDDKGFLTVKGKSSEGGLKRFEWEKEISSVEAEALLELCEKGMIDKQRYFVKHGTHIFEVDEFFGENKGLLLAELELTAEDEAFETPDWLGKEVTGDIKYYNAYLSNVPFSEWTNTEGQ
ncbi:MAG: CYTH domain-containing protein [Psychroserpens sp.]|nr:CYTH domain-containing protein [Psychroserpens sp.]